jgi:hypothetical protein
MTLGSKNEILRYFHNEMYLSQEQTNTIWNFEILLIFKISAIFRSRAVGQKILCLYQA